MPVVEIPDLLYRIKRQTDGKLLEICVYIENS